MEAPEYSPEQNGQDVYQKRPVPDAPKENSMQMRKGFGPQVLTGIRNFVIGLLRRVIRQPRTSPASALRYFAAHPERALAILTG